MKEQKCQLQDLTSNPDENQKPEDFPYPLNFIHFPDTPIPSLAGYVIQYLNNLQLTFKPE